MKDRVWREWMGRRPKTLQDVKCKVSIFKQKNKRKINCLYCYLQSFKTSDYFIYEEVTREEFEAEG